MNNLSIITDCDRWKLEERLTKAEQQRDELAAQVEVMLDMLKRELFEDDDYGVDGSTFYRCTLCEGESGAGLLNNGINHEPDCFFATLPNTAAILRQRDARTLRRASELADQWGGARKPESGGNALRNYAIFIRDEAAELEAQHG